MKDERDDLSVVSIDVGDRGDSVTPAGVVAKEASAPAPSNVINFPSFGRKPGETVEEVLDRAMQTKVWGDGLAGLEQYVGPGSPGTTDVLVALSGLRVREYERGGVALGRCLELSLVEAEAMASRLRIAINQVRRRHNKAVDERLGVRRVYWSSPSGQQVGSLNVFEAVIVERRGLRVRLEAPKGVRDGPKFRPRWSAGAPPPPDPMWFNEKTGEPEGLQPRRRHWRMVVD